jgi:predicted O-methyltransferase YrrM
MIYLDADYLEKLSVWLQESRHSALSDEIFRIGTVTAWRRWVSGVFGPSNFERGLLLHRLVELTSAKDVLELGTGRGFSSICMGMASETHQLNTRITTIDPIGPGNSQEWPIRVDDEDTVVRSSRQEMWANHVPKAFTKNIHQITSTSFAELKKLLRANRQFDIIFVDAGHNTFSVAHDVAYAIPLLRQGGVLVLDDFSPTEWYGLGAIMVLPHVRRFFSDVVVLRTDGVIYSSLGSGRQESGMLVATGLGDHDFKVKPLRMIWWRLVWLAIWFSYTRTWLFPLSKST